MGRGPSLRPHQAEASAGAATLAVLGRYAFDVWLIRKLRGESLKARYWFLMPVRDGLVLATWGYALCRRTVDWQGNIMRIRRGSRRAR